MIKKRPEIHERILAGKKLLVVNSRLKPMPGWQKFIVYLVCYGFGSFFLMGIIRLRVHIHIPLWVAIGGILPVIGIPILGHFLAMLGTERKYPFIVTELGLTISPFRCATWDEIDTWHFLTIKGLMRQTLSRAGEGTTLCVYGKKPFKFNFGFERNSYFAYQGYFLTDEQQATWRKICFERNVLESDNFPIF
ncbi:MAG: hypothetical protein HGB32_07815 [Geobacteraceae bacterium]|nr:hypothetical protein [Geobacteraceae bacterium]